MKPISITSSHILKLFDELWPGMIYAQEHKNNCLYKLKTINNCFSTSSDNHDILLERLCSIDGIAITIASGLIWSVYPNNRVPFDKYTLTYALDKKIIRTNNISSNYVEYSDKIKRYCDGFVIGDRKYKIEDFVREALIELEDSEYLAAPE